jgi:hypothetical protein
MPPVYNNDPMGAAVTPSLASRPVTSAPVVSLPVRFAHRITLLRVVALF